MSVNIIENLNIALLDKVFREGLSYYSQTNCVCTLTDDGFRIYRPANIGVDTEGKTMYGGMVLRPISFNEKCLQKGHRYSIRFEVKGKTSNAVYFQTWSNNFGWGGGGLLPSPSDVVYSPISSEWVSNDWFPYIYEWTINDDVFKVCTESYASFVAGQTYPSYRDFAFGFPYVSSTGTMGTDLYIRNLKMYDITTKPNEVKFKKEGIVLSGNFTENIGNASIKEDGNLYGSEIVEV